LIYHLTTNSGYVPWCLADFNGTEVKYSKTPNSVVVEPDKWCPVCKRMCFNINGVILKTVSLNNCSTGIGDCSGVGDYHLEKKDWPGV
jgi:hypothetical protein